MAQPVTSRLEVSPAFSTPTSAEPPCGAEVLQDEEKRRNVLRVGREERAQVSAIRPLFPKMADSEAPAPFPVPLSSFPG